MSDKKQRIMKDVFKFTSSKYIAQGVGFFTAIVMRKFLGPFYMGVWSLLKVFLGYLTYLFMGVDQGAINKIPLYAGQGDVEAEKEVRNNLFGFMLTISVLAGIALFTVAVLLRNVYPKEVIIGLYVLSGYVILQNMCTFYQILLRTKHNFEVLSKTIIFESVINLIFVFLLISRFKLYGLYAVLIIVAFLNIIFMHTLADYKVRFAFNKDKLFKIAKTGFPITVVGFLQWGLTSLDRVMIADMIGITFVGYYSIPIMARSLVGQLAGFGTVLYPRLMEDYGKSQNIEDIKKYVIIPPMINAYILPVILGILFFAVPLLVEKVLPQYIPGILSMQILFLSMFFEVLKAQAFHFIVALKKQSRVIPAVIVAIILNFIGNFTLIKQGYGIYGVAWATSIVTFLSFVFLQSYAMKHFSLTKEIIFFNFKLIAPLIYTIVVVLFLQKNIVMENRYIEVMVRCFLLIILSLPLFVYVNRVTRVFNLLVDMLRSANRAETI